MVNFIKALEGVTSRGATLPDIDDVLATDVDETNSVPAFSVAGSRAFFGGAGGPIGQPGINRFGDSPTGPGVAPQGPYGNPIQQVLASGAGVFGPLPQVGGPVGTYRVIPSEPLPDANGGKGGGTVNMTFRPKPEEEKKPDMKKVSDEVSKARREEVIEKGYSAEEADAILEKVKEKVGSPKDGEKRSADDRFAGALAGLPIKKGNPNWSRGFGNWYADLRDLKGDGLVESVTTERVKSGEGGGAADYAVIKFNYVDRTKGLVAYDVVTADAGKTISEKILYRDNDGKWYKKPDGTEPIADAFYDSTQSRLYLGSTVPKPRADVVDAVKLMKDLEDVGSQRKKDEATTNSHRETALGQKLGEIESGKFKVSRDKDNGKYTVRYEGTGEDFKKLKDKLNNAFLTLPPGTQIIFEFKNDSGGYTPVTISRDRAYADIYRAWFGQAVPAEKQPAAPTPEPAAPASDAAAPAAPAP